MLERFPNELWVNARRPPVPNKRANRVLPRLPRSAGEVTATPRWKMNIFNRNMLWSGRPRPCSKAPDPALTDPSAQDRFCVRRRCKVPTWTACSCSFARCLPPAGRKKPAFRRRRLH